MAPRHPGAGSTTDPIIVMAICFGWFILSSIQAVAAGFPIHPFTDSSFLGIVVLEIILATIAISFLHVRGFNLGHLVPVPSGKGCLVGLVLYSATLLLSWPVELAGGRSIVAVQPIEEMASGATISFLPLLGVSVINGLYEETFVIGYLQRTLQSAGAFFAIGMTILVRVLYHIYQGPVGALSIVAFGLVLSIYFLWRKDLWPVVFAHIFADFAGFSYA